MITLDEAINTMENLPAYDDTGCSYIFDDDARDVLHYLKELKRYITGEQAKSHLFGIPLNENVSIRSEGVYCNVCGTRLDLEEEDDENIN